MARCKEQENFKLADLFAVRRVFEPYGYREQSCICNTQEFEVFAAHLRRKIL